MTQEEPSLSAEPTLVNNTPECSTPQEMATAAKDFASKTIRKVESLVLYAFHEAPSYQQDNHYILSGYRGELNSFKRCISSTFHLHNETGTFSMLKH
jgi:hypothetical protein